MYEFNILTEHRVRYILTSLGIALCALLMLFLVSIYKGVSYGSVEYVREIDADLWVLQEHATNILRSTSLMPATYRNDIEGIQGVKSVSPVFFILASVRIGEKDATLYLTGYDPETGKSGPPSLIKGRNILSNNEIVIDKAFAAKNRIGIGDKISVRKDTLTVTGISTGTNMFVIQYAFITLNEAHRIIGFSNVVSCYQVKVLPGVNTEIIKKNLYRELKNIVVFNKASFIENNIREMESGIIPLLFIVTLISAIVLTAILSLILSISILEKRKDFAIMKALGSPAGFVPGIIIRMSLIFSLTGLILALVLFFPMTSIVERISPEVSAKTSVLQILAVSTGVIIISLISSVMPNRRIRKIYPLEVFIQ
jgi:ABC-type lipoprotein release transport system permease subunit